MIYLLKSAGYEEVDGEDKLFLLLKIGYTGEDNLTTRFNNYRCHNITGKIIYTIPNATEDHEKKLHYKFKDLKYDGHEWFRYDQSIIDYIKSVTLEELNKLPNSPAKGDRKILEGKKEAKKIISYLFDTKEEINNYLFTLSIKLGDTISYTTALDYISQDSTIDQNKLKKYYEIKNKSITGIYTDDEETNKIVSEFLKDYELKTTIVDRLRMLCECELPEEIFNIIMAQIVDSDTVKSYYIALGPEKLKSFGYNLTYIKKELGIVTFSPEVLVNTIYSNFHVGEKYLLSNLKNLLSDLYYSISYKATPKAIDIMNYFEVKEFKITAEIDGIKKRVRGYELVSSKEMEFRVKLDLMKKGEL